MSTDGASSTAVGDRLPLAALASGLLALTFLLALWRLTPPAPLPRTAPPDRFSAERARDVLGRLCPIPLPRPVGSAENHAVRQRLVAEIQRLGLEPIPQTGFECGSFGVCAPVTNLVAELPGATPRAIALMAHYDSAPASPGAADDGAGVASLIEIARAVQAGPPLRHTLFLVFTDGEEVGMLGARRFVREHPALSRIDTVINLEARGTRGPSTLFRTSPDATAALSVFAVPRPVASSLAREIFTRLPNETDLSQLLAAGVRGYDLAFLGGAPAYHTRLDSLANLSLGSVQHQGSNALALVRATDHLEARTHEAEEQAVYFDLLAGVVFWWPATAARPLAALTLLLLVAAVAALGWRRQVTGIGIALGLVLWLGTLILVALVALAGYLSLRAIGALPFVWVAFPAALHVFIGALATLGALLAARLGHRLERGELAVAALGGWALLTIPVSWWLPGASYLFLVPAVVGALSALAWAATAASTGRSAANAGVNATELLPVVAAGLLWWPIVVQLYAAIGFVALPINAVAAALPVGLAAAALTQLDPRWLGRATATVGGLVVLALTSACILPAATATSPRWTSLAYHQPADDTPQWLLDASFGAPPAPLLAAAPFVPATEHVWPGAPLRALAAPASGPRLPAPEIEIRRQSSSSVDRTVVALVRSSRGARVVSLHVPENRPVQVRIEGEPASGLRVGGYRVYGCFGVPPSGVEIGVTVSGDEPWSGLVVDHLPGLPESADFLEQARDSAAVAAHFGDDTLASRTLSF